MKLSALGWIELQKQLHGKMISWYRAEQELTSMFEVFSTILDGIPRDTGTFEIKCEFIAEIEAYLDLRSHSSGS